VFSRITSSTKAPFLLLEFEESPLIRVHPCHPRSVTFGCGCAALRCFAGTEPAGVSRGLGCERVGGWGSADWKSAIRQVPNLRYGPGGHSALAFPAGHAMNIVLFRSWPIRTCAELLVSLQLGLNPETENT
jgi:hypothetical protein